MALVIPAAPSVLAPLEDWQRRVQALEQLLYDGDSDVRAAALSGLRSARRMVVAKSTPGAVAPAGDALIKTAVTRQGDARPERAEERDLAAAGFFVRRGLPDNACLQARDR
ncbi:hypothetical protein [Paraburkholderia phosphatilytica]|uniref:hypothetical protein n=1 Tax=Paraburkholderia phosphatilytica TaxID=2282883 RepID=UPI000F602E8A|nr:hypothetical protein [Paraburkholderia phosphatilytica]